ncbi:MAG: DUF1508 domain-containing protein [Clostridia bacterium]|nr:DUF1508 domain-containing protein [Clostridia bacterium]
MAQVGEFEIYQTASGNYNFRLKASNKNTIAVSGGAGYKTLTGCKSALESIKKISGSNVEDQTLKNYETLTNPKFEIYMDKAEKFRFRLRAKNGELICVSEDGYSSKANCKAGIESVGKWAENAEINILK